MRRATLALGSSRRGLRSPTDEASLMHTVPPRRLRQSAILASLGAVVLSAEAATTAIVDHEPEPSLLALIAGACALPQVVRLVQRVACPSTRGAADSGLATIQRVLEARQ